MSAKGKAKPKKKAVAKKPKRISKTTFVIPSTVLMGKPVYTPTERDIKITQFTKITNQKTFPDWTPVFMEAMVRTGRIIHSCTTAGISRPVFYDAIKKNPELHKAVVQAKRLHAELAEVELARRAIEGTIRKKFDARGNPIIDPETGQQYVEREYHDTLLIFLLKALKPEVYRERLDHTTAGKPLNEPQQKLTNEQLAELKEAILDKLVARLGSSLALPDRSEDGHADGLSAGPEATAIDGEGWIQT